MAEHGVDATVSIFRVFASKSVAEIRKRMEPWAVHFLDQLHQKKGIFTDWIIIFQVDYNPLRRRVLDRAEQTVRSKLTFWLGIFRGWNVGPNAGVADCR